MVYTRFRFETFLGHAIRVRDDFLLSNSIFTFCLKLHVTQFLSLICGEGSEKPHSYRGFAARFRGFASRIFKNKIK